MSTYSTKPAPVNIVDEMMQALRPHVSPEAIAVTVNGHAITHAEARSASALTDLQQMVDELASLKQRLHLVMDSIGIAAGAWHCLECGEWTVTSIPHEDTIHCPRCVPAGVCPF
jgi:rubrerythrin